MMWLSCASASTSTRGAERAQLHLEGVAPRRTAAQQRRGRAAAAELVDLDELVDEQAGVGEARLDGRDVLVVVGLVQRGVDGVGARGVQPRKVRDAPRQATAREGLHCDGSTLPLRRALHERPRRRRA